jgi:hypothetical protein
VLKLEPSPLLGKDGVVNFYAVQPRIHGWTRISEKQRDARIENRESRIEDEDEDEDEQAKGTPRAKGRGVKFGSRVTRPSESVVKPRNTRNDTKPLFSRKEHQERKEGDAADANKKMG